MPHPKDTTENDFSPAAIARIAELESELRAVKEREARLSESHELLRKQMQDARKRYLAIIESFDGQIYICSEDFRIEFMNNRVVQRTGRDATGELCYSALHDLEAPCPWCINERVLGGETVRWEVQSPKDQRWYYVVNSPLVHEDGRVSKHAMIQDISERKAAEEQRRISEEKYRSIFDHAPFGIYHTSLEGSILEVNSLTATMLGYGSPEELLSRNRNNTSHSLFVDPAQRGELVEKALLIGDFVRQEVQYRRTDGSTFPATLSMRVEREVDGTVKYLEGFVEDISVRKRAEEELRKLSEVVKQSPISIVITDPTGIVQFVNPHFTRTSGYEPHEVLGKEAPLLAPETLAVQKDVEQLWSALAIGRVWEGEILSRRKSGEEFWAHTTISPIRNDDGVITHYVALCNDITEEKRIKEQLLQSQKMEAVGQLAGGIAHDFNNILTAIIGFTSIIQASMPANDAMQGSVTQVLAAAERAASLTQSLLAFSRTQMFNLEPLNLNHIVKNVEKFLQRLISEDISFRTSLTDGIPRVKADSGQMQQVLMNLVTNARDAMAKGGVLRVETALQEVDDHFVASRGCGTPGRYVMISVADTGVGMDEATRKKMFEPFFTTKKLNKGTGLGMSIVYGIVKQHNGFITIQSEEGRGTTCAIYLPALSEAVFGDQQEDRPKGGSETVLVAEDDAAVRALMGNILRSYGYRVILSVDGKQAVSKFEEHQEEVKLVLLDMIMPKMNGKEAYDRIRKVRPDVKALYFSGYTRDFIRDRGELEEGTEFMRKPVQPVELLRKVREMLDA